MESSRVYGIDLGTTHSCMSYVDETSGRATIVPNAEGDPTTPSVVLFEDSESRVVGKEAKNSATLQPERVVEMVKRDMGNAQWRFSFEDRKYSPEEVSSYILRKLTGDAETFLGDTVGDAVITCPAYFGISERDATAKAGEIAGLTVREVINEPTAAAIAYGLHDDNDQVVLVYDLGGGTFDVTLIEIKDGSIRVRATDGDHKLGGRDWDEEIVNYIASAWQQEHGSAEDPRDSEETLQDLWQRAEAAKHALTARTETKFPVSHAGQRVAVHLTREQFDDLTEGLLERTIQFTKDVLATAEKMGFRAFDKLLLVGGSTRMPQVARRLSEEFGVEPTVHEPDHAVAKGAAIYGHKLMLGERIQHEIAKHGDSENAEEQAIQKVAEESGIRVDTLRRQLRTTVTNVASHSFGVVALSNADGEEREVISNLVTAQSPLPASQQKTYYTVEANQPVVEIRIVENNSDSELVELDEGQPIGSVMLEMRRGLPERAPVEVTFDLQRDGRLHVTGRDLAEDGAMITAPIETSRSLSDTEVEQAKSHAKAISVSG